MNQKPFLLTPLREGRPTAAHSPYTPRTISTHAPAGGATSAPFAAKSGALNFYSRPCGRGDFNKGQRYAV